jgi:hypothetical protein
MNTSYFRRGEKAELSDKNSGNENQAGFKKYEVVVSFDGSEFFCRLDHVAGRSWNLRNINYDALRAEARRLFPRLHLSFKRTRAAELAVNPAAGAMLGTGRW